MTSSGDEAIAAKTQEVLNWARSVEIVTAPDEDLDEAQLEVDARCERYPSGTPVGRDHAQGIAEMRHQCTNYVDLLWELKAKVGVGEPADGPTVSLFETIDDWIEWTKEVEWAARDILKKRANDAVR